MPFSDSLFEIELSLCRYFPALSPLSLRNERAIDVFNLLKRFISHLERENEKSENEVTEDGVKVINIDATDDDFF